MLVEVRDEQRGPLGTVVIDTAAAPARVDAAGHDVLLRWEGAVDDGGHLRACVVCGCHHLYRVRTLPRLTPLLLAGCAVALGAAALGYSTHPALMALIGALIVCDLAVLVLARTHLACYRCGSVFRDTPVAQWHRAWDPVTALRLRQDRPAAPPTTPPSAGR